MTSKKLTKMLCKQSHQLWRVKRVQCKAFLRQTKCEVNISSLFIATQTFEVQASRTFTQQSYICTILKRNKTKKKKKCRVATKYSAAQMWQGHSQCFQALLHTRTHSASSRATPFFFFIRKVDIQTALIIYSLLEHELHHRKPHKEDTQSAVSKKKRYYSS